MLKIYVVVFLLIFVPIVHASDVSVCHTQRQQDCSMHRDDPTIYCKNVNPKSYTFYTKYEVDSKAKKITTDEGYVRDTHDKYGGLSEALWMKRGSFLQYDGKFVATETTVVRGSIIVSYIFGVCEKSS